MASKCLLCCRAIKKSHETVLHPNDKVPGFDRVHTACRAFYYPRYKGEGNEWNHTTLKRRKGTTGGHHAADTDHG